MSYDEPSAEEQSISLLRRVTPEELTRALDAIDWRKMEAAKQQEAVAQYLAETIQVEDAVRELSLEATPDEIWAEVQAQRKAEIQQREASKLSDQEEWDVPPTRNYQPYITSEEQRLDTSQDAVQVKSLRSVMVGFGSICLFIICVIFLVSQPQKPANPLISSTSGSVSQPTTAFQINSDLMSIYKPLDSEFYRKLSLTRGPKPEYYMICVSTAVYNGTSEACSKEIVYPTLAIPDGYSIYENPQTIDLLRDSQVPDRGAIIFRSAIETSATNGNKGFLGENAATPFIQMTRYNGQAYLRCWIAKNEIGAIRLAQPAILYTSPALSTLPVVPLTITLEQFSLTTDPYEYIQMSSFMTLMNIPQRSPTILNTGSGIGYRINIKDGQQIQLDQYAWENFPALTQPLYNPTAWAKKPGIFINSDENNPYSDFDASSNIVRIGQIADGRTFHCNPYTFGTILNQSDTASLPMSNNPFQVSNLLVDERTPCSRRYTLIKHEGHLYLCAWVSAHMTQARLTGRSISLYSEPTIPELGLTPTQISLRIDRCHLEGSDERVAATATNIKLDKYAWDKW